MKKICFSALCLFAACSGPQPTARQTGTPVAAEFLQEITTLKATLRPLRKEFALAGRVIADPDRTLSYSPLMSGVIAKSYFTLGDKVSRGQTMYDIRSAELSALQAELAVARRNLQSAETMFESRMISERELIEARSMHEKLQADFALYGQSKGDGIFSITAPIGGYVIAKNGNPGSTVSAEGEAAFAIADLGTVWVEANVYAGNLQFVHEGQRVEISSVSYPKEVFKGKIDFLSQVFDPTDKALKARIVLPNPELKLKPEMSVVVRLLNESDTEMITVPTDAVIFDNDRYFTVVRDDGFSIREVTPYDHVNGITYVSDGLTAGEEVVTKNQLLVYNELKGK